MYSTQDIQSKYSLVEPFFGDSGNYHNEEKFSGYGNFCDVYFVATDNKVTQHQVDIFNDFKLNHGNYLNEIDKLIDKDVNFIGRISLDVLSIPQDGGNYDLVAICSKKFKQLFFLTREITMRTEFKNGKIKSFQIKKNTTAEND